MRQRMSPSPFKQFWLDKKRRLHRWWNGEYKVKETPHVLHFYRDRSPWPYRIEALGAWALRNGWNITFLLIGLVGVWLAWLAL